MKKLIAILMMAAMVLALCACGSSPAEAPAESGAPTAEVGEFDAYDTVTLKMSCNGTDTANDTTAARRIAELVSERSGGKVTINVFNNDQLASGNMQKGLELLLDGTVDMDCHSTSIISALDNSVMVSTLPWLFGSYQDAEDAFFGAGGEYLDKVLGERGLTYLGAVHNGFKMMTSNDHAIRKPSDLKGMKIRIPGGDFFMAFYEAYGASPQAMSWSEVFSALQQGTIDGHDNSISTCYSNNIQEVQKYFAVSRHTYEAFTFMANEKKFAALNEATQQLIRDCVAEACKEVNAQIVANEETLIKDCEETNGCEFYYFTEEDVAEWRAVIADLIEEYKGIYGEEACTAFNVQ